MMETGQEMTKRPSDAAEARSGAEGAARQHEEVRTMAPRVDVFEDAHGITLRAEMPGVAKERLEVQADRNGLSIEGDVSIEMPEGMQALYADVQATRYR